jgi:MHS family proline/betaine transporter-like MFS transporter
MKKAKLVFVSGIASAFEWYDYALFGHFASIIGAKFFPNYNNASESLILAFAAFAIGYLMRPIGGLIFGIIGDKYGRKIALSSSVICMALPTTFIGILPTYETIGIISTLLLIIARMIQGLSMGGALTGSISFAIEHTDKKHRGFAGSISMSGICIGILFGSFASQMMRYFLNEEEFLSYGWRIPFLFGIFILFAGLYIKNNTQETDAFINIQKTNQKIKSPIKTLFKNHYFDMIISILINGTGSVIFYIEAIYLMSFLRVNKNLSEDFVINLANFCYIIMALTTLLAGYLSDKIGRKRILIINLIAIIIITPFLIFFINFGDIITIIISQIILAILASFYIGPEATLQAEFYPTQVRNSALSISYNTATSIFGGTTPLIMEFLFQKTGTITTSIYYILACAFLSLGALYFYKDRS